MDWTLIALDEEIVTRRLNKFNAKSREDFVQWTPRFESLFESKDLLEIVTSDPMPEGDDELSSVVKAKVNKARMFLSHSLGDFRYELRPESAKPLSGCTRSSRSATLRPTRLRAYSFRLSFITSVTKRESPCSQTSIT